MRSLRFVFAVVAALALLGCVSAYSACRYPDANCGGNYMSFNGVAYCCPNGAGVSMVNGNAQCTGSGRCAGTTPAPVDGEWSDWSTCSSACKQTRTCTNPAPSGGGADCYGSTEQSCTGGSCVPATSGSSSSSSGSATRPSGSSCTCTCCTGNYCSASLAGYVANSGCGGDCDSMCRSAFPSQCPAERVGGSLISSCSTSSSSGSDSGSGSGVTLASNQFSGSLYSGSTCAASQVVFSESNERTEACLDLGSTVGGGKVICHKDKNTASVLFFTAANCQDKYLEAEVPLGQCESRTYQGVTMSVRIDDCTGNSAAAHGLAMAALLFAAILAVAAQRVF